MNNQLSTLSASAVLLLGFWSMFLVFHIATRVAAIIYKHHRIAANRERTIIRNRLSGRGGVARTLPNSPHSQPIPDRQRSRLLTAATTHCGHSYVIRFAPDQHQQAVDQVLRWVDDDSVNLDTDAACRLGISISRALLVYSESRGQDESACD